MFTLLFYVKVLDAALAVFIALIADDTRHILELSVETDFIKVSVKLLPIATELDALWASEDMKTRATVVSASLPKLEMSMVRPSKSRLLNQCLNERLGSS